MKKKLLTAALATTMVMGSAIAANAELVSTDTTFDGSVVADGSAGWASAGTGKTFSITDEKVAVTFENDAFIRDTDNWSNYIIETLIVDTTSGFTARADAYAWVYGDGMTNIPEYTVETTWGDDWSNFAALTDNATVTVTAQKTDANTVVFTNTYSTDASASMKYTVTYPNGVPAGLEFQIGSDGGKVTLKSVKYGNTVVADATVGADTNNTTNVTPDATPQATPSTGDSSAAVVLGLVAAGAAMVAVNAKKKVTE